MVSVMIDPELVAKLLSNGGKVLLTDSSGKPLGHFVALDHQDKATAWMYEEPTAEELRRSFAKGGRHTMEEVLKLLEE